MPAVTALLYPDEQRRVVAEGHEVGIHGWIHERNSVLPLKRERDLNARAPTRWRRSPACGRSASARRRGTSARTRSPSRATWACSYDSSLMADVDCYELLLDGEPTGVVELPVEWIRDDAVYFNMNRFAGLRPVHAAGRRVRHLPPRVRGGLRGGRHLPAHDAPAHQRLSLAGLDPGGTDPPRQEPAAASGSPPMPTSCASREATRNNARACMDNFSALQIVRKSRRRHARRRGRRRSIAAPPKSARRCSRRAATRWMPPSPTSFAIGVVEPWMSGPAAGGAWCCGAPTKAARTWSTTACARRAGSIRPTIRSRGGHAPTTCSPWPAVLDDRNVQGATAVAVPGVVSGMGLAHARLRPHAVARSASRPPSQLAKEGLLVDWYFELLIASVARALVARPRRRRACSSTTAPGRSSAAGPRARPASRPARAWRRRLRAIWREGPRALYEGEVARALVRDVRAKGGRLTEADLAGYQARMVDALAVPTAAGSIYAAPGLTGGPTLAQALRLLEAELRRRAAAGCRRLCRLCARPGRGVPHAAGGHGRPPDRRSAPGCTTHFSVVDRARQHVRGHADAAVDLRLARGVALDRPAAEQRHHVVRPGAGQAQLARPRQALPGQLLSGHRRRRRTAAASRSAPRAGARSWARCCRLSSFLMDHGLSLEEAFHQPRIDVSGGGRVTADRSLPQRVIDALAGEMPTTTARRTVFPYAFACPAGGAARRRANMGCTEIMSPWGDAVPEGRYS